MSRPIQPMQYYDLVAPRPELHAYMFDESCGQTKITVAAEGLMGTIKSKLFYFTHANNSVQIVRYYTGEVVFQTKIKM